MVSNADCCILEMKTCIIIFRLARVSIDLMNIIQLGAVKMLEAVNLRLVAWLFNKFEADLKVRLRSLYGIINELGLVHVKQENETFDLVHD